MIYSTHNEAEEFVYLNTFIAYIAKTASRIWINNVAFDNPIFKEDFKLFHITLRRLKAEQKENMSEMAITTAGHG